MGYSLSWLAVRGIPLDIAIERLRLAPTGQFAEFAERDVSARPIPNDWSLIVARGCNHRIVAERPLAALSADCEVIACSIEEHVMSSSVEFWMQGHRRWRVAHDAQKGIDHLSTAGDLPEDFTATRNRFVEKQNKEGWEGADVDFYFEIPLVLAHTRVGFKHDEMNRLEAEGAFQVLSDTAASVDGSHRKHGWWFWR